MAADHIRLRAATLHLFTKYLGVPGCSVASIVHLAMPHDQLGWRSCKIEATE